MFYFSLLYKRPNNYFKSSQSHSNFRSKWNITLKVSTMLSLAVCAISLNPCASFVTNRRSVSYFVFASGGNTYSPNGVKVKNFIVQVTNGLTHQLFVLLYNLITTMETLVVDYLSMFSHLVGTLLVFSEGLV